MLLGAEPEGPGVHVEPAGQKPPFLKRLMHGGQSMKGN